MAVRVAVARSSEDLDELFRVRHEVFCGGGYMLSRPDGRIIERFDAYPGAVNVVAKTAGRVIGGMRLDLPSGCGVGADEYFDYSSAALPADTTGGVSAICLLPEYRAVSGVHTTMWKMLMYTAASKGLTHLRGSANPECTHLYERLGWRVIAPELHHDESGLDVVPMTLEIEQASDTLRGFIEHQELSGFDEVFERAFYLPGECVLQAGEDGSQAFLIIEGTARLTFPLSENELQYGPGELFGELAVLTEQPRTASIYALTALEVMVLGRDQLFQQIEQRPTQGMRLLGSIASRMVSQIRSTSEQATIRASQVAIA
jgi:N-acyl-L-homoserine lactone synthetase